MLIGARWHARRTIAGGGRRVPGAEIQDVGTDRAHMGGGTMADSSRDPNAEPFDLLGGPGRAGGFSRMSQPPKTRSIDTAAIPVRVPCRDPLLLLLFGFGPAAQLRTALPLGLDCVSVVGNFPTLFFVAKLLTRMAWTQAARRSVRCSRRLGPSAFFHKSASAKHGMTA